MNTHLTTIEPPYTNLSLCDFATAFYAKAEIQSACLALQDEYGVGVPLLLSCCWAGFRYDVLPVPLLKELRQYSEACSKQTIEPLREIRKTMKSSHDPKWPTTVNDWQNLRESIKKIELASEFLLLKGLEKLIIAGPVELLTLQQQEKVRASCMANIAVCFKGDDLHQDTAKASLNMMFDVICSVKGQ
jgi:uncharacterized protein (TIGR02444 family)